MSKSLCPAGCGKKFISAEHAKSHADLEHDDWMTPRRRGWATPYGFVDFTEPQTYEYAHSFMQRHSAGFAKLFAEKSTSPPIMKEDI